MTKTIKTAVSIQKSVFDQAEILAQQLNVSRSGLFELAVEDFIQRHQSESLLNEINAAYSDQSDINEQKHLAQMQKSHRRFVEGEW